MPVRGSRNQSISIVSQVRAKTGHFPARIPSAVPSKRERASSGIEDASTKSGPVYAGSVTSGLTLTKIALICVAIAIPLRGALLVLPERYRELATFAAPFVYGAGVVVLGLMLKLPERILPECPCETDQRQSPDA